MWSRLLVALSRGRNIWVKIAVLRNSRREAGCAQRNTRFWASNIFRRSRNSLLRVFFSSLRYGEKKMGIFFYFAGGVFFFFEAYLRVRVQHGNDIETGHWERHRHRLRRMANIVLIYFSLFLSIDLGAAMLAPSYS